LNFFYENAFIVGLIIMRLIFFICEYYELKNSGEILFKLRYKRGSNLELVLAIFIVILLTVYNMYYLQGNFVSVILVVIYILIGYAIPSRIIVTNKGFFYMGYFIEWESIVEISVINTRSINMKRRKIIAGGVKIRELENQKSFLEIANKEMY